MVSKRLIKHYCLFFLFGLIVMGCSSSRPSLQGKTPAELQAYIQSLEKRISKLEKQKPTSTGKTKSSLEMFKKQIEEMNQLKKNQNLQILDLKNQLRENIQNLQDQIDKQILSNRKHAGEYNRLEKNVRELRITVDQLYQQFKLKEPSLIGKNTPPEIKLEPQKPNFKSSRKKDLILSPKKNDNYDYSKSEEWFKKGITYYQSNEYLRAIDNFKHIRRKFPQHPTAVDAHYWLGMAYYKIKDYPSAALTLYDFVDQNPLHPNALKAKWSLALSLKNSGDIGLARDIFEELAGTSSPYRRKAIAELKKYGQN